MPNITIFSPYGDLPADEVHTTTVAVGKRDWAFLQGVYGGRGATQAVIYNLMSRFVQQLKNHGITDYDPDALKHAIEHCTVSLSGETERSPGIVVNPGTAGDDVQRSTEPGNRPEAVDRNDGRGTVRLEQPGAGRHDEPSVATGVDAGPVGRRKKAVKGQKRTGSEH